MQVKTSMRVATTVSGTKPLSRHCDLLPACGNPLHTYRPQCDILSMPGITARQESHFSSQLSFAARNRADQSQRASWIGLTSPVSFRALLRYLEPRRETPTE
jgi:hypothetical protein